MPYERVPFDTTKSVLGKRGLIRVTGINDTIFLKNRYQHTIDNDNAAVINQVHYLEERSNDARGKFDNARGLQKKIEAHTIERVNLYEVLNNLLNKETDFEKSMWNITQKNRKVTSVNLKQKFNESDIDEIKFDSMLEYLKQYPKYESKTSFKDILDKIKEKESELRKEKEYYINAVSEYNTEIATWEKEIRKADDKLRDYNTHLEEGMNKIKYTRYLKSIFYKIASEKTKQEVTLDTIGHRIIQFRNTLDIIKSQYSGYQKTKFVEMNY